jgi:hypothetical protein
VKPTLYELLFQFLQYNWRYFFRTSVAHTVGNKPVSTADGAVQSPEIRQQFVAIIRVCDCTPLKDFSGALCQFLSDFCLFTTYYLE